MGLDDEHTEKAGHVWLDDEHTEKAGLRLAR